LFYFYLATRSSSVRSTSTDRVQHQTCAPICEPESPAVSLTACIEKASTGFIDSIGADVNLPEDAFQMVKQHGEGVAGDIVINQFWDRSDIHLMFIHYYDSDGSIECVKNSNVDYGAKLQYTVHYVDCVTNVSVFVVVDNTWRVDGTNFVIRYQPRYDNALTCQSSNTVDDGEVLKNGVYDAKCNDEEVAEVEIFVTGSPNGGFPEHASEDYTYSDTRAQTDCAHLFVLPCDPDRMCAPAPVSSQGISAPVPVTDGPVVNCTGSIISMDKGDDSEMDVPSRATTVELVIGNKLTFSVNFWRLPIAMTSM
jgi:hypothetical protein